LLFVDIGRGSKNSERWSPTSWDGGVPDRLEMPPPHVPNLVVIDFKRNECKYGDPSKKWTHCVPPFKITQGHRNRHGSIGYVWLLLVIRSIYTILHCAISQINGNFGLKSQFLPSVFNSPLTVFPLEFCYGGGAQKLEWYPYQTFFFFFLSSPSSNIRSSAASVVCTQSLGYSLLIGLVCPRRSKMLTIYMHTCRQADGQTDRQKW